MQVTSGHVYMNEYACVYPRVGFVTHRTFVPGPSLLPAVPRDRDPMGGADCIESWAAIGWRVCYDVGAH